MIVPARSDFASVKKKLVPDKRNLAPAKRKLLPAKRNLVPADSVLSTACNPLIVLVHLIPYAQCKAHLQLNFKGCELCGCE